MVVLLAGGTGGAKLARGMLDVAGVSTANGARIQMYDCTGGNNQKFAAQ